MCVFIVSLPSVPGCAGLKLNTALRQKSSFLERLTRIEGTRHQVNGTFALVCLKGRGVGITSVTAPW